MYEDIIMEIRKKQKKLVGFDLEIYKTKPRGNHTNYKEKLRQELEIISFFLATFN